jgi:plastocyanin
MSRRPLAATLIAVSLALAAAVAPVVVQAGGGCHADDGSVYTEGPTTVVKMDVCSFAPTIARVPVGTAVRFLNSANIDHMVVGRSGTWASDILVPGSEYGATFKAAGTYPFSCPLHPGMVGAIVVGDGVGVSGGATLGLPAPVTQGAAPSAATSGAAPSAAAPSAIASAASSPATTSTRADSAIDSTVLGAAVLLAAIGGVLVGALGAGLLAGRRRPETASTR